MKTKLTIIRSRLSSGPPWSSGTPLSAPLPCSVATPTAEAPPPPFQPRPQGLSGSEERETAEPHTYRNARAHRGTHTPVVSLLTGQVSTSWIPPSSSALFPPPREHLDLDRGERWNVGLIASFGEESPAPVVTRSGEEKRQGEAGGEARPAPAEAVSS